MSSAVCQLVSGGCLLTLKSAVCQLVSGGCLLTLKSAVCQLVSGGCLLTEWWLSFKVSSCSASE